MDASIPMPYKSKVPSRTGELSGRSQAYWEWPMPCYVGMRGFMIWLRVICTIMGSRVYHGRADVERKYVEKTDPDPKAEVNIWTVAPCVNPEDYNSFRVSTFERPVTQMQGMLDCWNVAEMKPIKRCLPGKYGKASGLIFASTRARKPTTLFLKSPSSMERLLAILQLTWIGYQRLQKKRSKKRGFGLHSSWSGHFLVWVDDIGLT